MILLLIVAGSISLIHGVSWWLARKKWPEEPPTFTRRQLRRYARMRESYAEMEEIQK